MKKDEDTAAMLLPHQMFAKLFTYNAFEVIFPLEKVESFWNQALEKGDGRFKNHPALEGRMWKKTTLPLFLHGDGVEYQTRDSLMIYSWGSLLQQMSSLSSHFYIASCARDMGHHARMDLLVICSNAKWLPSIS